MRTAIESNVARAVAQRSGTFVAMVALSIPFAFPLLSFLFSLLPPFELPPTPLWRHVDDLVFDLPISWYFIIGAPLAFVLRGAAPPDSLAAQGILISLCWTPIALAFGWLTRRVRLAGVALLVYPTVWLVGLMFSFAVGAFFGYGYDTSI